VTAELPPSFDRFKEVVLLDFEYRAVAGERPQPLCMHAHEYRSGQEWTLWHNELIGLRKAPFRVGPDSTLVSYAAAAELSCFLELGWPLPENVLDLHAEHRVATNGTPTPLGDGLLGALALRGLAHIDAGEKKEMIQLICGQTSWSAAEQQEIVAYNKTDVNALEALLPAMASTIDLEFALVRGRYGAAVARMQRA
jgi:DNA polymerase I